MNPIYVIMKAICLGVAGAFIGYVIFESWENYKYKKSLK